ncbi:AbrB/MazE/SpoVT family protein [Saline Natrinema sp. J7-1 virus 1]|uniref:AbrB/MazE/SpoVT family protein n=1 Tax=Saline Natrinema sp. J7-1 virus 1 TaxID=2847285 RepID=A0AAF0AJ74_9VIRU|nr:AbrB/MazE/SpoVT family protein [Saline Natrinema sp. J7-1 virus 1]WBE14018.1 AbrB/MazE/SpoVT family protein [Saline Natrinema sp. J7-1 virus 1]
MVQNEHVDMSPEIEETKVSSRGGVTVPSSVRNQLGIEEGDKLRWHLDDNGDLQIEVVHQQEGVFDNAEPIDMGETNAVDIKEEFGSE